MAKLNKMEISAIADKIYSDIKKQKDDYNKVLKSEDSYKEWLKSFKKTSQYKLAVQTIDIAKEFNKVFEKIPKKRGYSNISISTYTIEDICESVWEDSLELKQISIDKSDIERDIIIAQAKNEDLDKLIKDLTEKYSV